MSRSAINMRTNRLSLWTYGTRVGIESIIHKKDCIQWTQFSACSTDLKHHHRYLDWQAISMHFLLYIGIYCVNTEKTQLSIYFLYPCRFAKRLKSPAALSYFSVEVTKCGPRVRLPISNLQMFCTVFLLLIFNSIVNIPHKNLILPQVSWRKIVPSYIYIYSTRCCNSFIFLLFSFYSMYVMYCTYFGLWCNRRNSEQRVRYDECVNLEFALNSTIRLSTCQL